MSVTSATTPNATTIVLNLDKAYNPGFFLNNQVQDTNNVFPMPSQAWNVVRRRRTAHQRLGDQPGRRAEDLRLPVQGRRLGGDVRLQPAVEGRLGSVQAEVVQRDQQLLRADPEPQLRRHAEAVRQRDRRQHLHRLRRRAQRDEERRAGHHGRVRPVGDLADRARSRARASTCSAVRAGAGSVASTTSRTAPTTSARSSRSCTPARHWRI